VILYGINSFATVMINCKAPPDPAATPACARPRLPDTPPPVRDPRPAGWGRRGDRTDVLTAPAAEEFKHDPRNPAAKTAKPAEKH
jgi:hypothetical protein